jgi:hypothetical protein
MTYYPGRTGDRSLTIPFEVARLGTWWIDVRLRRWFSITVPTSALPGFNQVGVGLYLYLLADEPTFKATSRFGLLATCRTTPDCTYLLKPSLLTSS